MGWFISVTGAAPEAYVFGARTDGDLPTSFLASRSDIDQGFATVMQAFKADGVRGQRVALSAELSANSVTAWAGLWMRIDGPAGILAFENMEDRAIKGTIDWDRYRVELEVPDIATSIALGFLLAGTGMIRVRDLLLETDGVLIDPASVGLADPTFERLAHRWPTDKPYPAGTQPSRERNGETTGWEAVTEAEAAVVRLTAEGLSNPVIAERLFISRHTVETHLKHVYAKTGITSRAQLAAEFVRRNPA